MFQVLFFPRLKEVSSWKTKKQGIISPNGGNRRGIFGSALKKIFCSNGEYVVYEE